MTGPNAVGLGERLRVLVVAERTMAAPRSLTQVVSAALDGGAGAIQLRNKGDSARELAETARALLPLVREAGALFFVNDRLDVALAVGADGIHVGPDDLPVAAVRASVPSGFLVGRSADEVEVARTAVRDGADYIGCGTVFATTTKTNAGDVIGLDGLRRVVTAVDVPVVGIGGITEERARRVAESGAAGVAVVGAVMKADDPARVVRALGAAFSASGTTPPPSTGSA